MSDLATTVLPAFQLALTAAVKHAPLADPHGFKEAKRLATDRAKDGPKPAWGKPTGVVRHS